MTRFLRLLALAFALCPGSLSVQALAQDMEQVPAIVEKPGGDRNVTNFDYVPPNQPRRKYAQPDPNALPNDIEFETLKDRVLTLEETVERQQRMIDNLSKRIVETQ